MISLKELKYVGDFANKAPYPGDRYANETFEDMITTFEKYQKNYKGNDYSIIFSDSSEINFEILESNVCHMLGIDYSALTSGYYNNFLLDVLGIDKTSEKITSYGIVQSLLDNYEKVIKYDSSNSNRAINYYKARIKCAIFDKMINFEKFNFGKLDTKDESKLLFTPSDEAICPYFLIRLNPDSNSKYFVSSLMAPERNQIASYFSYSASIPTQLIIDNKHQMLTKLEATPKEKIELLNMYKTIILSSGLDNKLDISGDYLSTLAELDRKQKRKIL